MKMPRIPFATILLALILVPALLGFGVVRAWWNEGHKLCTRATISRLPSDMPTFFRAAGEALCEMSIEPDNWKSPTTPSLRATEQPEHYIDLEYLDGKPIPAKRFELIAHYQQKGIELSKGGFLPYALQENYERLMLAFREHRNRPDALSVQQRIIVYAGWLAHYAQDAAMPLHTTQFFDGRPGTGKEWIQKGIHEKIDKYPETHGLTQEMLSEGLNAERSLNVWPVIVAVITESHRHIDKCYELDAAGGFDKEPAKGRQFMIERARLGVKLTLDLWYSAWVNSDPANATIRPAGK